MEEKKCKHVWDVTTVCFKEFDRKIMSFKKDYVKVRICLLCDKVQIHSPFGIFIPLFYRWKNMEKEDYELFLKEGEII